MQNAWESFKMCKRCFTACSYSTNKKCYNYAIGEETIK